MEDVGRLMRSENEVSPTPPSRSRGTHPHACPVGQTLTSNSWRHPVPGNLTTPMSLGIAQNSTNYPSPSGRISHESSPTPASPTTPTHQFGTTAMRTGPVGRYTPDVASRAGRISARSLENNTHSRATGGSPNRSYGHGVHRTLPRPNRFASPYSDSASGAAISRSNVAQPSSVDFHDLRHIPGVTWSNNENVRPGRAPGLTLQFTGLQETDDIEDQMNIDDFYDDDEDNDDPSMTVSAEELMLPSMPSVTLQLQREAALEQDAFTRRAIAQAARQSYLHAHSLVVSAAALNSIEAVDLDSLEESDLTCIICYNEYDMPTPEGQVEKPVRLPKCRHVFGHRCLRRWLADNTTCPHCRDGLPTEMRRYTRDYLDAARRWTNRRAESSGRPDTSIHNSSGSAARQSDQAILQAAHRAFSSRHRRYGDSSSTHAEMSWSQSDAEIDESALPRRDISRHMPQSTRNNSSLPSDFARSDSSYHARPLAPLIRTNTGNVEERSHRDQHLLQPNYFALARGSTHQPAQTPYADLQHHVTQRNTSTELVGRLQRMNGELRSSLQNNPVPPQPRISAASRTTLTSPLNYDHLSPWQLRELLATTSNPSDTNHTGYPSGSGNRSQHYGWTASSSPGATLGSETGLSDFSTTAVYDEGTLPPPFFSGPEDIEPNHNHYGYDM